MDNIYLTDTIIPESNSQTVYYYFPMEESLFITQVRRTLPMPSNQIDFEHYIAFDANYAIEATDGNYYAYKATTQLPLDAENLRVVDINFNEQPALIKVTEGSTDKTVEVWFNITSGVPLLAFDRLVPIPSYKSTEFVLLKPIPAVIAEGLTFEVLPSNKKKIRFLKDGNVVATKQIIGTPSIVTRFLGNTFRLELLHVFPFTLDDTYIETLTIPLSQLARVTDNIYLIDLNYQTVNVLASTAPLCDFVGNVVVFCKNLVDDETNFGFITIQIKRKIAVHIDDVLMHLNENYQIEMPGVNFPVAFVSFSIPRS